MSLPGRPKRRLHMFRRAFLMVIGLCILFGATSSCTKKKPQTVSPPPTVSAPPAVEPPREPEPAPVLEDPAELTADDLLAFTEAMRREGRLGDVFFDFDRFDLDPDARERLSRNAELFRVHPELVVTIEGHCDERDTNEYNLALGERRAQVVRRYLESLGIHTERLRTVSFGEERPFCAESHEDCWSQNRRAHFVLTRGAR